MSRDPGSTRRPVAPPPVPAPGERVEFLLSTAAEVVPVLDQLVSALEKSGYAMKEVFALRLALEEAVVNGLKHGNKEDPSKKVRVRYRADTEGMWAEIEDQGDGFDPDALPDPLAPENLENPSGRGVFLIKNYMDWVEYNDVGNRLRMYKKRPTG